MSKRALIIFIAAVLILLSLGINLMYAQSEQALGYEGMMKKLELILKNQAQIKEDLELIKLAVARI
ncbi:MAG: hypothetical protein AMJ95_11640 [Omnitrophica WOR_2 bacterium SM23_72]|nr:MAG: hypothetical protein AMJ95_11640 [Omnitrophica WOR_2 bacterium SM23_72]